jgi:DNA-binding SARP family transcriptional activator
MMAAQVSAMATARRREELTSTHATDLPAPPRVHLRLLGGFGLQVGDDAVALAPSPQRLVALLALQERAVDRGYIAGTLWGASTEAHAHGSLRSTLWKLRVAGLDLVQMQGDCLALAQGIEVDVRRVSHLARALFTGCFDDTTIALM